MNKWIQLGSDIHPMPIGTSLDGLQPKVYMIKEGKKPDEIYLTLMQDSFTFDYKIYNSETKFINRVAGTWKETTNSLGILLNGVPGTGKTVTAKLICNKLKLPVLVVSDYHLYLPQFINSIDQDVIIFIDEYDKYYNDSNYDDDDEATGKKSKSMLTVMDGVLSGKHRRVFLLTTNDKWIHKSMKERPGRIRYIKEFNDMEIGSIEEIVNDKLKRVEFRDSIITFLSGLETITVDIVKTVVEEVNIHAETPDNFADILNIKPIDNSYDVFFKEAGGESKEVYSRVIVSPSPIKRTSVGVAIYVNGDYIGNIKKFIKADTFTILTNEEDEAGTRKVVEVFLKQTEGIHESFYGYSRSVL